MQVIEICPYYFDLEEKFLERAGIKRAATTDELFEEDDDVQFVSNFHLDNLDTGMNSESSEGLKEDQQKIPLTYLGSLLQDLIKRKIRKLPK